MPKNHPIAELKAGATKDFIFDVTPPNGNATGRFFSTVTEGTSQYQMKLTTIEYPHISKQYMLTPNESKGVKIDFETKVKNIAYLQGAGDKVAESLINIGLKVTEFSLDELRLESIIPFPTLVVGIRAFNVNKELSFKNESSVKIYPTPNVGAKSPLFPSANLIELVYVPLKSTNIFLL